MKIYPSIILMVPVDFGGSRIQLSGFVRTEDVTGFAAMWMRLDGSSGPIAFDTTQKRRALDRSGPFCRNHPS